MAVGKRLRFKILRRDLFTCRYCGRRAPDVELEVDHVVSLHNGGDDQESNLVTACFDCNRGKSAWSAAFRPKHEVDHIEDYMWLTLPAPKPCPVHITFDLDHSPLMKALEGAHARYFYSWIKGTHPDSGIERLEETDFSGGDTDYLDYLEQQL